MSVMIHLANWHAETWFVVVFNAKQISLAYEHAYGDSGIMDVPIAPVTRIQT